MKPQVGQPIPPFSLMSVNWRGTQKLMSPESLHGTPFILFVYPRDNTPGCTTESCHFRDLYLQFQALGVEVLGVSRDSLRSHQSFIKKSELPFPLLADERRELIGSWGLIINASMYGKDVTKTARTTVFTDAEGIVREVWEDVAPVGHAAQVLEWVRDFVAQAPVQTAE